MTRQPRGPVFLIELQAPADSDDIHDLRAILKILLRRFGWRCLAAHQHCESPTGGNKENTK